MNENNDSKALIYVNDESEIKELMSLAEMPSDQIKRAMDLNYLSLLVKNNPRLDKIYFVDFINKAQLTGADPRLNQIYLIAYDAWNSATQQKEPKGTTVFSYQYFIRLAQQTGQLEDFDVDTKEDSYIDFNSGAKRKPSLTSFAWVRRKGQGTLKYKARLWEFAKTDKNGNLQGNWRASTYLMLEKCAIANVMRWAFPEVLGNMYIKDEMEKATGIDNIDVEKRNRGELSGRSYKNTSSQEVIHISNMDNENGEDTIANNSEYIELKKTKLLDIVLQLDDSFFEKVGKKQIDILDKINASTDIDKIILMENYINSFKGV